MLFVSRIALFVPAHTLIFIRCPQTEKTSPPGVSQLAVRCLQN